jgi:hypothetical protein
MHTCQTCGHVFAGSVCPLCGTTVALTVPAVLVAGDIVEGTVVQSHGPAHMEVRADPWKWGCALLALAAFFPIIFLLWAFVLAIRLSFWVLGFGSGGRRGRSLLDELLFFHLFGTLFRRPEPVAVYHHVVEEPTGHTMARQEGEFIDGRVFVGNRVRFRGRRRGGTMIVRDGYNETLNARLTLRRTPWRAVFIALLLIAIAECAVFLGSTAISNLPVR